MAVVGSFGRLVHLGGELGLPNNTAFLGRIFAVVQGDIQNITALVEIVATWSAVVTS